MFDKKKLNFWRLAFAFSALTLITLLSLWNFHRPPKAAMMSNSMGSMMKQMHASEITLYDLFAFRSDQDKMRKSMDEMHSHHQNQGSIIYKLSFISTALIFLLLPLIVGGAVTLAILWTKARRKI